MSDGKEPNTGETVGGCLLLIFLAVMLGQCVFGGDDEDEIDTETTSTAPTGQTILSSSLSDARVSLDSNAASYVAAHINSHGHLCARITEIRSAGGYQYGVGCILNSDGSGRANYLVDGASGNVSPI